MKKTLLIWATAFCGILLVTAAANFGGAKGYQVTGPITEVTPTSITVKKGQQLWQVNRDASTKVTGDLAVGTKVTIYYIMTATDIEVKTSKSKSSTE